MQHSYELWPNSKDSESHAPQIETLAEGFTWIHNGIVKELPSLLDYLDQIRDQSPYRQMTTPGGYQMSVEMTNCGEAGWVTDRKGYRYAPEDPLTGKPWPPMPQLFLDIASHSATVAGFPNFVPDVCLINRYRPGSKLSLHQDRDEKDFTKPIVSISLGLPATFRFGGLTRSDKVRKLRLEHGDILVWGGPLRLAFHGIDILKDGEHPLLGSYRINLTFRKAL